MPPLPPERGGGYGGEMAGELIFNSRLDSILRKAIQDRGLAHLWASATPMHGGRGTARALTLAGWKLVLKRERRGGWAGRALPGRYLWRRPFLREWTLGCELAGRGLAPEPVALEFTGRTPGFQVYTLSRAILPSCSLAELWRDGRMDNHVLDSAGRAVARLHREGVLHGDLNAGNILFDLDGEALFLDLRHSRVFEGGLPPRARRQNVLRLCRSLHKLHAIHGLHWPEGPGAVLAAGYAEAWGLTEPWLDDIVLAMDRGFPWRRRLFWNK